MAEVRFLEFPYLANVSYNTTPLFYKGNKCAVSYSWNRYLIKILKHKTWHKLSVVYVVPHVVPQVVSSGRDEAGTELKIRFNTSRGKFPMKSTSHCYICREGRKVNGVENGYPISVLRLPFACKGLVPGIWFAAFARKSQCRESDPPYSATSKVAEPIWYPPQVPPCMYRGGDKSYIIS